MAQSSSPFHEFTSSLAHQFTVLQSFHPLPISHFTFAITGMDDWADSPVMPPSTIDLGDTPPPPIVFERRKNQDRRGEWRGGRRDSDWVTRPPDALAKLERQARMTRWRRALASLHLW